MEKNVDDRLRTLLDARLNADMSRRRFIQGAAGLTTLTVLGLNAGSASGADGKLGGPLNFLGYDGEQAANVAGPFLRDNNIQMNASFTSSADEPLTRFMTGGRGALDLFSVNKDFQSTVLDAGTELFLPLDMARIPNAGGLFPAFKDAPWLVRDGKTYGVPLIWGNSPCVWNPEKWEGVPDRYTDFADPKFKGELVLLDDPFGNICLFAKSTGAQGLGRLTQAELDKALEALISIKPNIVTLGTGFGDMADVIIRGDASIGIGGWAYQLVIAKEKGVTLVAGSPKIDDTLFWSDAYAIAVDAPNIDNAYAFIDYVTSAESNAALATELGSGCTVEAAYDLLTADAQVLYNYDDVRQPGGGILGTQASLLPPQEADGDIVGVSAWIEAWQTFKAA
ncbi:MAG: extracellular solute-binding protein [Hyphomicrobiales bacterium]|nr:MAG: extracellular solute-binding protein [Hyphomicrobiales bacterium]